MFVTVKSLHDTKYLQDQHGNQVEDKTFRAKTMALSTTRLGGGSTRRTTAMITATQKPKRRETSRLFTGFLCKYYDIIFMMILLLKLNYLLYGDPSVEFLMYIFAICNCFVLMR